MGHSDKKRTLEELLAPDIGQMANAALSGDGVARKDVTLYDIVSCFLDGVGENTIEKIIDSGYDTLEKMSRATVDGICSVSGIKKPAALLFVYGLRDNIGKINDVLRSGRINLIQSGSALKGISFCFTGVLETIDRNTAKEKIRALGGTSRNSVTKDLTFLVTNDEIKRDGSLVSGSVKNIAAHELGISVINEKIFLEILEDPNKAGNYIKL